MLKRIFIVMCTTGWMLCGAVLAAGQVTATGSAQTYPGKPIRIIVPYGPGGGGDLLARAIGQRMTET